MTTLEKELKKQGYKTYKSKTSGLVVESITELNNKQWIAI